MKPANIKSTTKSFAHKAKLLVRSFSRQTVREYLLTASAQVDTEQLRASLQKMIGLRVLILTAIFSSVVLANLGDLSALAESRQVFLIIAITYAVSLANAFILRRTHRILLVGYVQLGIDVLLATVALYTTVSLAMVSLYLFVIVAAAFLLGRHAAVGIAALCGLCYAGLASGAIVPLDGHFLDSSRQDIFGVYTSLVVIALVSSYIARQLETIGERAADTARHLTELSSQQRQLFDGMSEGIITVDLASVITGINEAARAIIGVANLEQSQFVGKPLKHAFAEGGFTELAQLLRSEQPESSAATEITITRPVDHSELRLACSLQQLTGQDGHTSGRVLRFNDVSHLRSMEERLTLHERMTALLAEVEPDRTLGDSRSRSGFHMIGNSEPIAQVKTLIDRVAPSDASVLICGESGTGKELIARGIHERSRRANRPFVAINCGAIPENLIESELFGHKKGSFTGAVADKPGLFREAEGGTIFLDEIGELPLHLQSKLLRVLQERSLRAVGDTKDAAVDVRIVAATNRDLKQEVAGGRFRDDLYYRLNVVQITVPPLRERKEDIPLLVKHFVTRATAPGAAVPQISPEALQALTGYNFPGNIRELENLIERALVLGGNAILANHLPDELLKRSADANPALLAKAVKETSITILPINLEHELERLERHYLNKALEQSQGLKKEAARLLGLNFRSFRYRLKKYGMSSGEELD